MSFAAVTCNCFAGGVAHRGLDAGDAPTCGPDFCKRRDLDGGRCASESGSFGGQRGQDPGGGVHEGDSRTGCTGYSRCGPERTPSGPWISGFASALSGRLRQFRPTGRTGNTGCVPETAWRVREIPPAPDVDHRRRVGLFSVSKPNRRQEIYRCGDLRQAGVCERAGRPHGIGKLESAATSENHKRYAGSSERPHHERRQGRANRRTQGSRTTPHP